VNLSRSFTLAEMTVTSKPLPNDPNPKQLAALKALCMYVLQPLRDEVGRAIQITSGFRSERVNAAVGGASTSQHKLGEAADIKISGLTPKQVCETIIRLGLPFDQLICEFNSWVHVSYGPKNRREILTAVKRGGKTVYLPGLK
jgi:zinc D-Ala-D-Ala carboxypeptidase